MIKQWSIVAKLSFLSILLLFVALPIRSAADSYLGDDGKIKFKVDRLRAHLGHLERYGATGQGLLQGQRLRAGSDDAHFRGGRGLGLPPSRRRGQQQGQQ